MAEKHRLPWDPPPGPSPFPKKTSREQPGAPYHTWRWTKLSRAIRVEQPLCAECKRRGIIRPATCVDHIEPWPICGEQGFFDRRNLQPLCDDCNNQKGLRDKAKIIAWKRAHPGWEATAGARVPGSPRKRKPRKC
ncbi:MAG: HNH endonuclease [Clostridia bacterium]|nr:HNH endonuclease [Clostridia bacterium]